MSLPGLNRRLGPMDAFFLYLEREEEPMSVGCLALFEGKVPFKKFVASIESRLHLIPRYRQKVVPAPLNIGLPTWEYDPDFDIRNHIHLLKADPPGDEYALRRMGERLFQGMLDRNKPLWDIYLIHGMKNNRTGMLVRVHHCMIDGIAGVGLMQVIFDAWPNAEKIKKQPYNPDPIPGPSQLLYDALWDNLINGLDHWARFQKGIAEYCRGQEPGGALAFFKEFAVTMRDFLAPAKRMPFNKAFSGQRRIACANFSFAEARAVRTTCGGTLNDVALTVLSGAVQRYMELHGESLRRRFLRVLVPVNIRQEDERGAMGNRISFLPVEVPIDVKDPVERLRLIHETTQHLKKSKVSEAIGLMFNALQGLPAPLQALALTSVARPNVQSALGMIWQVPPMHLICTNVPGPQIPLYCVGHRLMSYYPLLPIALEMGISCGITSYDQRLYISLIADANTAPDVDKLMDFMKESFVELRVAAAVKERHVVTLAHAITSESSAEAKGNGAVKKRMRRKKEDSVPAAANSS